MGIRERMQASTADNKADRAEHKATRLAEKNPQRAAELRQAADELHHQAEDLRALDTEQKAAKTTAAEAKGAAKADLAAFRTAHPLERQMNHAAMMHLWPKATHGQFSEGPVRGAHAELFDSHHRQRGAGMGTGQINIQLANGVIVSRGVKQEDLRTASRYVMALNAYADQLAGEAE